ncbi:MAG: hypothetical protein E7430_07250 [Ruminococcaceae bacterium]|nr:hypothetical protein [Oscillospiraceae bacterium]
MNVAAFFADISVVSIVIFVIGVAMLVAEVFQPGFGFFGVGGIICLLVDIIITADTLAEGLIMAAVLFVLVALLLIVSAAMFSKGRLPKKLVLTESTDTQSGFSGVEDMQYLLGKEGKAVTDLRPAGMMDMDGVRLDVVSRGDYIRAGSAVEVVEVESNRIVVRSK